MLAGSRASGDPLAASAGVAHKALVHVGGASMLEQVLAALRGSAAVGRLVVCGMDAAAARTEPALDGLLAQRGFELADGAATPAASVAAAIASLALSPPLLITTADHPLLRAATVDEFCAGARAADADVAFGLADADAVSARFPGIRRTRYRFRDGAYCGCNLYALLTPAGLRAPTEWTRVESERKRPWRMVAALGPLVLLRFLLGRLALAEATAMVHRRFGVRARPVHLSDPAAGFDVDNAEQRAAADAYLRAAPSRAALRS